MVSAFYAWMKQFRDEDTARGDLARDMKQDKNFPQPRKRASIREYLRIYHVPKDCLNTFEKCYQQYLDDIGIFTEGSKKEKIEYLNQRFGEPIGHLRGTPILRAVQRLDWPEGWRVWCKYCWSWHLHGLVEKTNLNHKCAHCSHNLKRDYFDPREESQYCSGGYYILSEPVWPTQKSTKKFSETRERIRKHFTDDELL